MADLSTIRELSESAVELSGDVLQQVTGAGVLRTGGFKGEKRKATRIPLAARGTVVRLTDDQTAHKQFVRVRDVSALGVGFLCAGPMNVGEQFIVTIPRRGGNSVLCRCSVIRSQSLEAGLYVIGAIFEQVFAGGASASGS